MKKEREKKPCFFCRGLRLRKIDFLLIVIVCVIMYWANQYQMREIEHSQGGNTPALIETK
ncbi:hypothetical protein BBW65_03340 [Helicobacter enhydrae]|uniref:Uncharacterized protein n=1 Tax=Helicobacter enhydrae TaxID=222136 RepID=A0A1B1U583_9HELI|nr:hypothetical protein [Helicobacter enhydrae]ANV97891.1 hypothetical protein BBW65_03340 [Helicobacter enhydrae]